MYKIVIAMKGRFELWLIPLVLALMALVPGLSNDVQASGFAARIAVADSVIPGDTISLRIDISPDSTMTLSRLGQIEISLHFDSTLFTLYNVGMPDALLENGWAPPKFFFAHVGEPDCGSAQLTLILLADNRWFDSTAASISNISVDLEFIASHDVTLFGDTSEFQFCWRTCDDNCFYSASKDTSYIARDVFDFEGNRLSDGQSWMPTLAGPPQLCYDAVVPIGKVREATVDFHNGAVVFTSRDGLNDRGDVNLDGLAFEPSDLTLLGSHCLIGDEAYQVDVERQLAVSDIDEDGVGGTVADWVALRYIITGESVSELPRSGQPMAHLHFARLEKATEIYFDSDVAANAFRLWFQSEGGEIDSVRFAHDHDPVAFEAALTVTREKLLQTAYSAGSINSPSIPEGFNRLLTVFHNADAILTPIHVEAATAEPRLFSIDVATGVENRYSNVGVPLAFTLHQNYPNPFNPGTEIRFDLQAPSHWQLEVFDIRGRCVREYTGSSQSGSMRIYWDGCDSHRQPVASGIYLYRLTAGESQQARKMLLLR